MAKNEKKRYERPVYKVEEIFEKMSLACPAANNPVCKVSEELCDTFHGGGQIQAS
jgi:hypothetical protein